MGAGTTEDELPGGGAQCRQHAGGQPEYLGPDLGPAGQRQRHGGLYRDPDGHHQRQRPPDLVGGRGYRGFRQLQRHRLGERPLLPENRDRSDGRQQLRLRDGPETAERALRTLRQPGGQRLQWRLQRPDQHPGNSDGADERERLYQRCGLSDELHRTAGADHQSRHALPDGRQLRETPSRFRR